MVNFFVYAKDFSGSTNEDKYFNTNGLKTYEDFKLYVEKINQELIVNGESSTESKIVYLHWGDECFEVDENEIVSAYKKLQGGNMLTDPKTIIEWIKSNYNICDENNKIKLLYIVTDGVISRKKVEECFVLNENVNYETVVFHAFHTCLDAINLSVAAPFLKKRCITYRNYELYDDIDISEDFDYDKITLDNLKIEKDSLISYIKLKFIKTFKHDSRALQEIENLKKLKIRLFAESELKEQNVVLETKDRNKFLTEFNDTSWYQNVIIDDRSLIYPLKEKKINFEKLISTLISYIVSDQRSYSFDASKVEAQLDNIVNVEPITEIQFPDIILDKKEIHVILLIELNLLDKFNFQNTKDSPEVSSASFDKFKSTMDCPLFLLDDQDVIESINSFCTLNVYKDMLENAVKIEPRTLPSFRGGLVLIDSDEFDKYNDHILSATYFNSKEVNYNIGLFYFVLWKISENKELMDKIVVERFKIYVMRRISMTICNVGLSSLPQDPPYKTSLLTALWYCVDLSSYFFKHDYINFMQERLRMYYNVAHFMIEILQYFNYDLDWNAIKKRVELIQNVMILKNISKREEKVYYLLEKIFKKVNGFLVCEIEKPFNLITLSYLNLNYKVMLYDSILCERVHLNDYVHFMHFVDIFGESNNDLDKFEICEDTYRPFFTIDQKKLSGTELVSVTDRGNNDTDKGEVKITYDTFDGLECDRILSLFNLFINCVKDFKKYPTFPEYIEYILAKKKFHGSKVTIFPSNVYIAAEKVYSGYQHVMTTVNVNKFINAFKNHAAPSECIKADCVVETINDVEINMQGIKSLFEE